MKLAVPECINPNSIEGRFPLCTSGVPVFWSLGSYPPCQRVGKACWRGTVCVLCWTWTSQKLEGFIGYEWDVLSIEL